MNYFPGCLKSGYGCTICDVFVGALCYADDVVLLCPSRVALVKMLSICEHVSTEYFISFNPGKTKLVLFPCENAIDNVKVYFQGRQLVHSPFHSSGQENIFTTH